MLNYAVNRALAPFPDACRTAATSDRQNADSLDIQVILLTPVAVLHALGNGANAIRAAMTMFQLACTSI